MEPQRAHVPPLAALGFASPGRAGFYPSLMDSIVGRKFIQRLRERERTKSRNRGVKAMDREKVSRGIGIGIGIKDRNGLERSTRPDLYCFSAIPGFSTPNLLKNRRRSAVSDIAGLRGFPREK
jgi:hypothetical protein